MSLLDASGRQIPKGTGAQVRQRAMAESGLGFGQVYQGATHSGTFMGAWPTRLQSADRDYLPARYTVVGRARDLVRNDPVAQSAVSRKKNAAIGKGWRLTSTPNAYALGIEPMAARQLGRKIRTEWQLYANSYNFQVDAERKLNFGQLLRLAASHLMVDGEFLAKVEYAANEPTRYKTRLRMVDPDRLSNPIGRIDSDTLRGGVETTTSGVPVQYWIREKHQLDLGVSSKSMTWAPYPRYSTPLGRPNILHGFDPDRAGQTRGISRFAAALKSFKGFSQYEDATIQSAVINALILGYMQSSAGPEAVSESLSPADLKDFETSRKDWYGKNPVALGDAVLPVVPYGDELKLATASKDVGSFEGFVRAIIRLIAASLGITYEELSMDYSQTNYSSARAAMVHAWADTVAFMGTIEAHLVRPFFVAWLEEAFDSGFVEAPDGAPDFYDAIDAYAEGRWIGPGRGYIDPTKEILAAAARIEAGISTLEDECADQGKDYEEVLDQLAYEKEMRAERGLQSEGEAEAQAMQDTKNPARGAQNPTDDAGDPVTSPEDARPAPQKGKASALMQIRAFAGTAEHEDFLNSRPSAIQA